MPRGRSTGRAGIVPGRGGYTYDFGVAIAAGTVRQLQLLTGSALGLTAAMYGLGQITSEYVNTLKTNTLYFGGQLRTMKAMQFAQDQLLKGATEFGTGDILHGMKLLSQVGVDAAKNFQFMSDAAKATGLDFTTFASNVNHAIQGNMGGLVEMGLMTQRATRAFDKFAANTTMRQQAILNFIKNHKGLQKAIEQSFNTISGQWKRVVEGVKMFAQAIMGNPKDPNSLYRRIVDLIGGIAGWMNKYGKQIRMIGTGVGQVLGWVVKQVHSFAKFIGRQIGRIFDSMDMTLAQFQEKVRSALLWLDLWRAHIVAFFKKYKNEIIGFIKITLLIIGLKKAFDLLTIGMYGLGKALYYGSKGFSLMGTLLPGFRFKLAKIKWGFQQVKVSADLAQLSIIQFGRKAKTALVGAASSSVAWSKNFGKNMVSGAKKAGTAIAGVFTGGGGFMGVLTRAGSLAGNIFSWFTKLGPAVLRVVGAVGRFLGPIGIAVTAVITLYKYWDKIWPVVRNIAALVWNIAVIIAKTTWGAIKKVWNVIKTAAIATKDWLMSFEPIRLVVEGIKSAISWISDKMSGIWDKMKGAYTWVRGKLSSAVDKSAKTAGKYGIQSYETAVAKQGQLMPPTVVTPPTTNTEIDAQGNVIPRVQNPLVNTPTDMMSMGESSVNEFVIQKGAVTITVQKGDNINEDKLKRMVESALTEIIRKNKLIAGK